MDKPFITVSGVSKEFEGEEVLRDVSVEIREGEPLGLFGRSGAGKSVLLHMLRGNEEYAPTVGRFSSGWRCAHYALGLRHQAKLTKCALSVAQT